MRQHPIGTGPFKFVEFKPNESIKVTRNPDYWKSGRPYLDGIEYTINRRPVDGEAGFRVRQVQRYARQLAYYEYSVLGIRWRQSRIQSKRIIGRNAQSGIV